ncbi:MAG: alpha/beta hydrolase [Bacteroidota bacterium]
MSLIKRTICVVLLFIALQLQGQSKLITVGKDSVGLYIEDFGKGRPIVFIPGWTMTTQFFQKQTEHFRKNFRFITYDPRSHGKSSKAEKGHTYKNHAEDLSEILKSLDLKDIVLVGWSSGCATIYEYVALYGIENLSHLVFIDEPPKWIGDTSTEWVYGSFEGYRESLKDLIQDRESYAYDVANWMTKQELDSVQQNWMVKQMLMTPNDVALSLYIDGMVSDYNNILKGLNKKIPMLFMVRESWYDRTMNWLRSEVSEARVASISSHAEFWEKPEDFNSKLETFITNQQ